MNKFITSTSLLSIGLLTSCATIKGFRGDPDTWGKKGKKEKIQKSSNLEKRPSQRPATQTQTTNIAPERTSDTTNTTAQKGRTVEGMMEPDVTKLPDNKDLQESNNVAPIPVKPQLDTPVAPLLPNDSIIDPNSPLPSNP